LQDRLWHLCERQATSANKVLLAEKDLSPAYSSWPMTKRHYLTSTIYLFSRYFCWVEILKSRVRFLEFGDDAKTSAFNYHLKRVERALAETSLQKLSKNKISTDKPIFQLMQTEIGEQLRSEVIGEDQCMSFHDFRTKFDEILNANEGMQELQVLIISSMSDAESNFCLMRLKIVCNALMDMVIFLCEHNNLIPAENLEKIKIDAFDINKYLENWPAEMPNSAVQPTAFV
jgi:hypothetical protein